MVRRARRQFDRNFKLNALRMILDVPLEEVSRKLDIHRQVLHRWKHDYKENPNESFPGHGRDKSLVEKENRRLQRTLKDVEEERDILKKALVIFSRPGRIDLGS